MVMCRSGGVLRLCGGGLRGSVVSGGESELPDASGGWRCGWRMKSDMVRDTVIMAWEDDILVNVS